jgi:SAM-dependent methyltransferase
MLFHTRRIEFSAISYWDKQAAAFNEAQMEDLTQKQLSRLLLLPKYTVLDVGAGAGRLTIPIAKCTRQVTALEPAANMMALLKENAQKEHISNIEYVDGSIEELDAAAIGSHDIVLASFSLLMVDVEKVLLKMDAAASKGVYLFVSVSKWMNEEIQDILYGKGVSSPDLPDYIYIYNILHDAGILANVDIWDFQTQQSYNSLDDAAARFTHVYRIPADKQAELKVYLTKTLLQDDNGKFWLNRKRKAAMIWWTKTQ